MALGLRADQSGERRHSLLSLSLSPPLLCLSLLPLTTLTLFTLLTTDTLRPPLTNQVWNSCADIKISSTEPPTPPPSPAPPAPPKPPGPPKPPAPKGKGCKAYENPTCKGDPSAKCAYSGCKKCHDDKTFDCDECCDGCKRTYYPSKSIHYCASGKEADPLRDDLTAFLEGY